MRFISFAAPSRRIYSAESAVFGKNANTARHIVGGNGIASADFAKKFTKGPTFIDKENRPTV